MQATSSQSCDINMLSVFALEDKFQAFAVFESIAGLRN
jgi:hypothetical protein